MSYVICNIGTGKLYTKPGHYSSAQYATERGAKISCTKLNRKVAAIMWDVWEAAEWRAAHPVKMVKRINLMSGLEYEEAEDTALCCSPASERYWSM
jgi:hypothetical protein